MHFNGKQKCLKRVNGMAALHQIWYVASVPQLVQDSMLKNWKFGKEDGRRDAILDFHTNFNNSGSIHRLSTTYIMSVSSAPQT